MKDDMPTTGTVKRTRKTTTSTSGRNVGAVGTPKLGPIYENLLKFIQFQNNHQPLIDYIANDPQKINWLKQFVSVNTDTINLPFLTKYLGVQNDYVALTMVLKAQVIAYGCLLWYASGGKIKPALVAASIVRRGIGGKARSKVKSLAARANGAKGGRPRQTAAAAALVKGH